MTQHISDVQEWRQHLKRIEKLTEQRRRILSLPPEQAINDILDHPQATALVHSFAEEDFFFLIHDIGPGDSLELLSLASDRQWEFILDVETWQRDQLHLPAMIHWMNLMMQADPNRFVRWAMSDKQEMIEYCLFKSIDVIIREHDQDPSDFDDGFTTVDDIFYFRIPEASDSDMEAKSEADNKDDPDTDDAEDTRKAFLTNMLHRMASNDHVAFQQLLLRSLTVIPAESEEEAYRFRNVRLAEKGFLPFDEAVGIYQPINTEYLKKQKKHVAERVEEGFFIPAPINHAALMGVDNLFSRNLARITLEDSLNQIQIEFAALCNRIIAADQEPIRSREELRAVVKKTCAYLEIGLEKMAGGKNRADDSRIAAYIRTYPLMDIFRIGYSQVANLRNKALRWRKNSWFAERKLALSFWGEHLVGMIGGLLLKRPRFFDNFETGVMYREFESIKDVKRARAALKEAMVFDDLLSCMAIRTDIFPENHFITFKNLLLTLWARHELKMASIPQEIPVERFRSFFEDLWETGGETVAIREEKKTGFLRWLSAESGFTDGEISENMGHFLEGLFAEMADEYREVRAKELEPRFVHLFLLKDGHKA